MRCSGDDGKNHPTMPLSIPVNVSETACWRLQHKYRVEENAEVDIKGIGMTKTYTITAEPGAAQASEPASGAA